MSTKRFRFHPSVVHQTVDGESILIQMESGNYFSLQGAASLAWAILSEGCTATELASRLRDTCTGCPASGLEEAAAAFIEELRKENLLVEGERTGVSAAPFSAVYSHLGFEKFTDMQDLLLADPIHEVGEAGWPALPPQ